MAVVTGTPWDLALDQRAHRATPAHPAARPVATATSFPGAAVPPVSTATAAATSSAGSSTLSARAAYQHALYGRTVLVDLRTADVRRVEGDLDPALTPVPVPPRDLITWLVQRGSDRDIVLVSEDGAEAAAVAEALAEVSLAQLGHVTGGFAAWRDAGLPID